MTDNRERFTGKQADYAAARPDYARGFLDRLRSLYPPPDRFTAADIGSGTGKLSAQLLEAGFTVYAVEPNGDMRREAEQRLGSRPGFRSVEGCDRATGLEDQSVDFVTAAQAFHWFDPEAFGRECRRILRREGRAFLVWNVRNPEAPVTRELAAVFQEYCPDFYGFSRGLERDDPRIRSFFGGEYESWSFPHPLRYTQETFLRRAFSSSYSLTGEHPAFAPYRQALEEVFHRFAVENQVTVDNETVVYTARVR